MPFVPDNWTIAEEFVEALSRLRHQRGHLITIGEYRYIDQARISALDTELAEQEASLSEKTVAFLSGDNALAPYFEKIVQLE